MIGYRGRGDPVAAAQIADLAVPRWASAGPDLGLAGLRWRRRAGGGEVARRERWRATARWRLTSRAAPSGGGRLVSAGNEGGGGG